jgi:three-Cys-motif partner protein
VAGKPGSANRGPRDMDEIDKAYEGSEHSWVKHKLLEGYLEKLLFIKGIKNTKEITYVDCFAGPYQDESEELQATSIGISLKILKKVREALAAQGKHVTFRAVYVEEDEERFGQLRRHLDAHCPDGVQAFAIYGDFSAKVDKILERCGSNSFVFFFIDPFGWTDVAMPRIEKFLRRRKSEFLITFMYDFFMRFVEKPDLRNRVTEMLGPLTDDEYDRMCASRRQERETFIVTRYRSYVKAVLGFEGMNKPRTYHAVIKDKDKDRTKYHLVYATRHEKGIVEFAKQSAKAERFQWVERTQRRQDATPQGSLFTPEEEANMLEMRADIGEVKDYWLGKLIGRAVAFDEAILADMLEETGWLETDFQDAFKELVREKRAENLDAKSHRPKRIIHFDKGERLRRLV